MKIMQFLFVFFVFSVFSFCETTKTIKKTQNQPKVMGFGPREGTINPNIFSFHCDSFINEKELKECLIFLFNSDDLKKYRQKTNDSDFYFIAWQNKNAIPYYFTLKPSFNLYKINCDSLYEKKYLAYLMFYETPEGSIIEIEPSDKMNYYYWSVCSVILKKDKNGMYYIAPPFIMCLE